MSAGLPVLGSILSQAAVELVTDGQNGWLFDPRLASDTTAAIGRFFDTPVAELRGMGEKARQTALAITPDRVAQRFVESCELALRQQRKAK